MTKELKRLLLPLSCILLIGCSTIPEAKPLSQDEKVTFIKHRFPLTQ